MARWLAYATLVTVLMPAAPGHAQDGPNVPLGHADFRPSPEHPVGFRGDWTGRYPGAAPVLEWSFEHNVLWRTPVGNGEASPIVVGDRLFIVSDGVRLACLDKADGAVLWQREHHARRDVPEEAKAWKLEEYAILHHRARPLLAQATRAQREKQNLENEAKRSGKQADAARLVALQQQADDAKRNAAVHEDEQKKLGLDEKEAPRCITYVIATPCSDGRCVYAWLPLGEVVCYDLAGNRQWLRLLGDRRAGGGWGGAQVGPSPLLADGKLVIHYDKFHGLDAATGKTLWTTPTRGLPIPSPIGGRRGDTWYAMMGNGQMLRVADGKVVFDPPWKSDSTVQSPIFYDDVFCSVGAAIRLPETPQGNASAGWFMDPGVLQQVDAIRSPPNGPKPMLGWHGYSCPVYDDGLVYYHAEHSRFSAFEAKTGRLVFNTPFPCNGEIYPGAVLAGEHLFLANRGGRMLMVTRGVGAKHRVAAENNLPVELGGNMPVFDGRRFYLRMTPREGKGAPIVAGGDGGILFCFGDALSAPLSRDPPPPAAEALAAQLDDPNDRIAFAAARALRADPARGAALAPELVKRLGDKDSRRVRMALLALRALGPTAKDAAARVIPLLWAVPYGAGTQQLDLHRAARAALRAMGPAIVPALIQGLKTTSRESGWQNYGVSSLCALLLEFGPAAKDAVPPLLGVLRTGAQGEMRAAFGALRTLDFDMLKEKGVSALAERTKDVRATGEKRAALELLGAMGADAKAAISAVEAVTKDANADTARAAEEALAKIRSQP